MMTPLRWFVVILVIGYIVAIGLGTFLGSIIALWQLGPL